MRLSLIVLASTAVIFAAAFTVTYFSVRAIMLDNAEAQARQLTRATAFEMYGTLSAVMSAGDALSALAEDDALTTEELHAILDQAVERSSRVAGAAVAFEPYSVDPDRRFFAPFSYEKNGEIHRTFMGGEDFNYFVRDWYQIPRETGRPFWTDPFLAEGGADEMIATYGVPLYRGDGDDRSFIGVLALDISLAGMLETISSVSIFETGFAFLVSSTGAFVTYPDANYIMRESFFSLAEEWELPELRGIGRAMLREQEGFVRLPNRLTGEPAWMYYAPMPAADWTLSVVVPERELFGDVLRLMQLVLTIACAGFVILLIVIVGITRSITRPLKRLAVTTGQIARGNLDEALPPVKSDDEVGDLSRSFDEMRLALKDYISNLTETTKAKERIESELKIARNIQMSFLPRKYSLPANVTGVELHASLESAKHVGGDLYDFFMVEDRFLYFAVGDVSDKGVPAALFMAVTKTLVKGIAEQYSDPAAILYRVNNELCLNNENGMFVTYVCGLLNLETGEAVFANAGHNLPIIRRAGKSPEWLDLKPALVLGAMEDIEYDVRTIQLRPGDKLLLYTDGVVEAENENQQLYGDDTLLDLFTQLTDTTPKQTVSAIMESVKTHAGDAPASDDITVLALHYTGTKRTTAPG